MQYTVQELADKFKFAANKFIEDKKLDEQQKKINENARYDKAYAEMLKCKSKFADVKTLANSLYDYLHVIHHRLQYCCEELYQPSYKTGYLSIGRNYFIYNCVPIERNRYNGDFRAILISYDDGSFNRGCLSDNGGTKEDYANIVKTDNVYPIADPKKFVEECNKQDEYLYAQHCYAKLDYFSEAMEQVPARIDALFKFATAFADTVDGNIAMAEYLAKYRK